MGVQSDVAVLKCLINAINETHNNTLIIINNNNKMQKTLDGMNLINKCYEEDSNE